MKVFHCKYDSSMPLSKKEQSLIILAIIMLFATLIIPVYQSAKRREVSIALRKVSQENIALEEQSRVYASQIAQESTLERVLEKAQKSNLSLQKISFDQMHVVITKEEL